jgi:hypothetical protein
VKLYRPATVLVGVLFVLLGGLTRLAAPDQVYDEDNRTTTTGTIGQTLNFGGSDVTVTRSTFVKSYRSRESQEQPTETNGIFVAIEYDTVRRTAEPPSNTVTLIADGGSVYAPVVDAYGDRIDFAEPGFGRTAALVFEVNPDDLAGLKLKIATFQLFTVLAQNLEIDLGVPDETIARQEIEKAHAEYLIPESTTRVAE